MESHTSFAFQLALDAALSSATVVAKVKPFSCSGEGRGVSKLTITMIAIETTKSIMQKYRKFKEAKLSQNPERLSRFSSRTILMTPIIKPITIAVYAPFAFIRFENTPSRKTAAIGGAR